MSEDGKKAIRVGVLGVGRIGRMHARLLAHEVPGASLGIVYDAVPAVAEIVGRELDVPVAASADELIAAPEIDAVAICTSTDTHVELLVAAAASGNGLVAAIQFRPVAAGTATLTPTVVGISSTGQPVTIRTAPATVVVK